MRRLAILSLVLVAACSSSKAAAPSPASPTASGTFDAEPVAPPNTSNPGGVLATPTVVASAGDVSLTEIARLAGPVAMAYRKGDPAPWIVEQRGTVERLVDGKGTITVDLRKEIDTDGSERGLLGIAFSPDGSTLYLDGTIKPHGDSRVWAFPVAADGTVDTTKRTTLVSVVQPFPNHNGGNLVIGPDGLLYVGLGDGGSSGDPQRNGQNKDTLLAKILRLDPSKPAPYIPAGNPFVGDSKARGEIWLYGVRNPWRFSFDMANGDLWIGDVGQDKYEEVDHLAATNGTGAGKGANLGWSDFEADHTYNQDENAPAPVDPIAPVFEYSHVIGCSITGGYVYRGTKIPSLVGHYIYSDYCAGGVRELSTDGKTSTTLLKAPDSVSSFGEDPSGELYVMSTSGGVYALT